MHIAHCHQSMFASHSLVQIKTEEIPNPDRDTQRDEEILDLLDINEEASVQSNLEDITGKYYKQVALGETGFECHCC